MACTWLTCGWPAQHTHQQGMPHALVLILVQPSTGCSAGEQLPSVLAQKDVSRQRLHCVSRPALQHRAQCGNAGKDGCFSSQSQPFLCDGARQGSAAPAGRGVGRSLPLCSCRRDRTPVQGLLDWPAGCPLSYDPAAVDDTGPTAHTACSRTQGHDDEVQQRCVLDTGALEAADSLCSQQDSGTHPSALQAHPAPKAELLRRAECAEVQCLV